MVETIASYTVPEHYVKMYTANVQAALVKQGGIVTALVSQGSYSGEKVQVVNFIGPIEFVERDTPFTDTKLSELEHTQRWITGKEYDCAVLIDRLDALKMIYDPTSPYVDRMREAAARKLDEIIVSKFFATAKTGKDGGTDTVYAAANTVVNGGTGYTVAKLRSLRKLMRKRQIDLRTVKPMVLINAEGIDDLLQEVAVTSHDYNAVKPLVDGDVSNFMGFTFIPYEDSHTFANNNGAGINLSGNIRSSPAWVMDGMHLGQWQGLNIIISPRPDKNNIKQIHATFTAGAARLDEKKVFSLDWDQSV